MPRIGRVPYTKERKTKNTLPIIKFMLEGKSRKEIAGELKINEGALQARIAKLARLYDAKDSFHLVGILMHEGYLKNEN